MATKASTIEYIEDQMASVAGVRSCKMFGEYALYVGDKVVALVCDDTLYVKVTEAGRAVVGADYREGVPYPGAKPAIEISEDFLEDRERLTQLFDVTAAALPEPKPKKPRRRAG